MLEGMIAQTDLRAFRGKKIVEVKPIWANKGSLFDRIVPLWPKADFVLAIGDDRTDEDLFSRLTEGSWSIHVGGGTSKARSSVTDSGDVRRLLASLTSGSPALQRKAESR